MNVIGIAGKAGSGKDTFAIMVVESLCGLHRAYAHIHRFADPLREAAQALFNLPSYHFEVRKYKEETVEEWGLSPRQMMQLLGTECVRNVFGQDFWIKHMRITLESSYSDSDIILIPDVRFENEAGFIESMGGFVVYVDRPGLAEVSAHVSEGFDSTNKYVYDVIHNDSDLDKLRDEAQKLARKIIERHDG